MILSFWAGKKRRWTKPKPAHTIQNGNDIFEALSAKQINGWNCIKSKKAKLATLKWKDDDEDEHSRKKDTDIQYSLAMGYGFLEFSYLFIAILAIQSFKHWKIGLVNKKRWKKEVEIQTTITTDSQLCTIFFIAPKNQRLL